MNQGLLSIVSIILWLIVPVVVFIARHWLIARVSKGVEYRFNRQIEELRAELRRRVTGQLGGSALDRYQFSLIRRLSDHATHVDAAVRKLGVL